MSSSKPLRSWSSSSSSSSSSSFNSLRSFSRADAIAFDRHAMESLGVSGVVLMENAAIGCVAILRELVGDAWPNVRVEIVCGSGNNGGDGYAIARHCMLAGAEPRVRPFAPPRAGSDAATNAAICTALGIASAPFTGLDSDASLHGDVVVDALFGTGLDRRVGDDAARVIDAINRFAGHIVAIDLPSGLDADSGEPLGCAVRATLTATMVAPKLGFDNPSAATWTGKVVVVSIGVPGPMM